MSARIEHPQWCNSPVTLDNCPKWIDFLTNWKGVESHALINDNYFYMNNCFNICAFCKDTQTATHGQEWKVTASMLLEKKVENFPALQDQLNRIDMLIKKVEPLGLHETELIAVIIHFTAVFQQILKEVKK